MYWRMASESDIWMDFRNGIDRILDLDSRNQQIWREALPKVGDVAYVTMLTTMYRWFFVDNLDRLG
jgi:hypothetical protein